MKLSEVKNLDTYDRFIYWIREREKIRIAKEKKKKKKPWTDDEILQSFRFCNVCRRDDAVTRFLVDEWYVRDHKNIVVAACMARHFNVIDTLRELKFPRAWSPKKIKIAARKRQEKGNPLFSGAYIVTGEKGSDKVTTVIDTVCQNLVDEPPTIDTSSVRASVEELITYPRLGWFLAGQIVADLRWVMKGKWVDKHSWAAEGPGSIRGMNRLLFGSINMGEKYNFQDQLKTLMSDTRKRLESDLRKKLEAIDYQNCLCEFDKYERVLWREGRPKRLYDGA